MARLVSYKVKDESSYSTFPNNGKSATVENKKRCKVCCCCSNDSISDQTDDIEFALIQYEKELRTSTPRAKKNLIIPLKVVYDWKRAQKGAFS